MSKASSSQNEIPWLSVCGEPDSFLSQAMSEEISRLRSAGKFSQEDQAAIRELSFSVTRTGFSTSPERMELLRRLCQLYSADVRPLPPTSHRRLIGPFIVLAKRLFQPIIYSIFGRVLRNQSEFNAATISLLTDLCNDARRGADSE